MSEANGAFRDEEQASDVGYGRDWGVGVVLKIRVMD